jgi:hypothetical protein
MVLLTIVIAVPVMAVNVSVSFLPGVLVPVGILVLGLIGGLIKALWPKSPLNSMINSLQGEIITVERIDKAVEMLLAGGKPPTAFIDWVGDVVGEITVSVNQWPKLTRDQRIGIVASVFSKLARSFVEKLLPGIPSDIANTKFAKKAVATKILTKTVPDETLIKGAV